MVLLQRTTREIDIRDYDLTSIAQAIRSIPIEDLAIRFTDERRYDVGSLCYTARFYAIRKQSRPVEASSIVDYRRSKIQEWIIAIASESYINLSEMSCYVNTANFAKFANWSDQNGHKHFLATAENYHEAYGEYTAILMGKIATGQIIDYTANRDQAGAYDAASLFFPEDNYDFRRDVPLISNPKPTGNPTQPPSAVAVGAYTSVCDYLFNGITDFLLSFKKFPARLELGTDRPWLLLGELPFATKSILAESVKPKDYLYWDYEKGTLRTVEEAYTYSINAIGGVKHGHQVQVELLQAANKDLRHARRLRLAKLSHDAFLGLFFANTGLNESPVRNIPWDPNYEITSSKRVGFRTIKFRADNRVVEVDIESIFVKDFNKFVKLRKYLLGSGESKFLFLGMTVYNPEKITKLRANELFNFNQRLKHYYDKNFTGLGVQELRAYKAAYWQKTGKSTEQTAQTISNTPGATRKYYTTPDEAMAVSEIAAMLNRLMQLLDDYTDEDIPAGACDKPGDPKEEIKVPQGYEPDCKKLEGCIYCLHFRLHPNEEDIRKLLSMRFVIKQRITNCKNVEQFLAIHQPAIDHIDLLLETLKSTRPDSAELIAKVSFDITENFELTDYWERQYSRLLNLGIA